MMKRSVAELIGTFWLVFAGCGSALLASEHIGWLGISLAFGLTVVTMAYAIGPISGCHLNPAVTLGLLAGRRIAFKDVIPYMLAQVGGALLAAVLLHWILAQAGTTATSLASNGYADGSPTHTHMLVAFVAEAVLTFMFLFIILGATDKRAAQGFAPLAIGLGLTLIHLVGIPLTNLSVNPARSTGPALVTALLGTGPTHLLYLNQLWLFWAAPLIGAVLAGIVYPLVSGKEAVAPTPSPK